MRIVVIGKYPPIEGGVSADTYWLCRQLAEHGHQVTVVTNADEVENDYRMFLNEGIDRPWMESQFPQSGGFVRVRYAEKFSHRRMSHIPQSNPYVSRLASVAAQVCAETQCQVMLAYYFEPYGVAAQLVSLWTGIPYVLKHAGSDLDRLMAVPDMAETYRRMILSAAAVLTRPDLAGRFLRMGVAPSKIITDLGSYFPSVFQPAGSVLDVDATCAAIAGSRMNNILTLPHPPKRFDASLPTIGIYGKIGRAKGSYDLVSALGKVREQLPFNLLCLSNGVVRSDFVQHIARTGLSDRTWILPFLPHWRVPEFIRRCTAVCFLERDFPVAIHGPQVPREILSCGRCLIVSEEIVKKQPHLFSTKTEDVPIAIVIKDPRNIDELANSIIPVLRDPQLASIIGNTGYQWVHSRLSTGDRTDAASSLLARAAGLHGTEKQCAGELAHSLQRRQRQMVMAGLLPWSSQLIKNADPELWTSITDDEREAPGHGPLEEALGISDLLLSQLGDQEFAQKFPPYFASVVKLEQHQIRIFINHSITREPFGRADILGDRKLTDELSCTLWPIKNKYCQVHTCEYEIADLQKVFESDDVKNVHLAKSESHLLLVPQPNFALRLFRMAAGALRVFDLCNGGSSVNEIVNTVLAGQAGPRATHLKKQVLDLIGQLYKCTAIVFASESQAPAKKEQAA